MPVDRRQFLLVLCAAAPAHAAEGAPEAHVRALYAAHLAGLSGSARPLDLDEERWPAFLTRALTLLWRKANVRTPKGEVGPVDFDPFTASQDPEVKNLRLSLEDGGGAGRSATVLARFDQHGTETRVAFTLLREAGGWRVDDVVPLVGGKPWSLRRALSGRPQRR